MHARIQSIFSVRAWIAVSVLVFAIVGIAPDVHAQTNKQQAQELAQSGAKAFVKKDYAMAVTYFQRAASLDPNPVLLYNLSLAHSKLGNVEDARDAAQRALDMGPEGVPSDTLTKLKARNAAYERALGSRSMAEALAPEEQRVTGGEGGEGAQKTTVVREQTETEPAVGALGWAGVGTGVVGVGLLAGAGLINADVRSNIDAYDDARRAGNVENAEQLQGEIESGQQTGQILLYSGAGLVAVGTGLFIFDLVNDGESEKNATLMTAPTEGGASVQIHVRF